MQTVLLHPCYFGPISEYVAICKAEIILFENEDNFQKQTYRNRMYIYGANGKLSLNIPVKHTGDKTQHQKYKDVRVENDFRWQNQHWKSLQTAYRTSPFFEFYEDDFFPLYHRKYKFLMDFNYDCFELVKDALQIDKKISKTEEYKKEPAPSHKDLRHLVNAKDTEVFSFDPYGQVFDNKYGYIENLSVVDLLFNEGPSSSTYLEAQRLRPLENL